MRRIVEPLARAHPVAEVRNLSTSFKPACSVASACAPSYYGLGGR